MMEQKEKAIKKINVLKFMRCINEQYGIEFLYEETNMDEKTAMESIDRIMNSKRFYTAEFLNISFSMGFEESDCNRLNSIDILSINLDKVIHVFYSQIEIEC
jgi:hypothetical protein